MINKYSEYMDQTLIDAIQSPHVTDEEKLIATAELLRRQYERNQLIREQINVTVH